MLCVTIPSWGPRSICSQRVLSQESSPFAYVIIDGDGAVFREDLIAQGEEGGSAAAHELLAEIKTRLQEKYNYSHLEVFVQVVLSIEGLSKALFNSGTLKNADDRASLTKFARGFCRAQPLFSFVDVGYGKEQADNKVRKVFEVMEKNLHCRALILGGCHDNGYATFLEAFRNNHKITLLETTPAAADFRKLPFGRISLPHIFRSDPLPSRSVMPPPGFGGLPILSQNQYQTYSAPVTSPSAVYSTPTSASAKPPTPVSTLNNPKENEHPRPGSWAAVGRTASGAAQVIDISSQKKTPAKERNFYQLNKDDERVDVPLAKFDPAARDAFDKKTEKNGANFCNRFHLLGTCKQFEVTGRCPYIHGERLAAADQLILRSRARGLPCGSGSQCRDAWCTSGHHCPNPKSCWYDDACRFADMHGMDTTPTIRVYEDGAREVVV